MAEHTVTTGILEEAVEALGLDDSLFMPTEGYPIWQYTGPLDDVREWFEENTHTQVELSRDQVFTLKTFLHERSPFWPEPVLDEQIIRAQEDMNYAETSALSYEDAWRNHLGELLVRSDQPCAYIGVHGETLEQLRKLLKDFNPESPDYAGPETDGERELYDRWLNSVIQHGEVMGYRAWVKDMISRG